MAATATEPGSTGDDSPILRVVGWVLAAALAGLYLFGSRSGDWFGGDEAKYVGLALSLSEGAGYVTNGLEHAVYPPGYPLALLPMVRTVGLDPSALTMYSVVLSLLSLGMVWIYLRERGDVARPWAYVVLMLASVGVFEVFTDLRSEGVFALALFLLLTVFERLGSGRARVGGAEARSGAVGWVSVVVVCGLASAFLPAVRAIGIAWPAALLATVLATGVTQRRLPPAKWLAAAVAGFVGAVVYQMWWWRREAMFGGDRSYMRLLSMVDPHEPDLGTAGVGHVVVRLLDHTGLQLSRALELLTNVRGVYSYLMGTPQVLLGALVVWGVMRELRRPNALAGWLFLGYVGVVVLWPFDEGTRFLVPVFPLIVLFAVRGAAGAWQSWPGTASGWRRLGLAAAVGAAAMAGEWVLRDMPSPQALLWIALWVAAGVAAALASRRAPARPRRGGGLVGPVWVALFLLVGAPTQWDMARRQHAGEEKFQAARIGGAVAWIGGETEPHAHVGATSEAQAIFLHTGRRTVELPATADTLVLWGMLDDSGSRYLVVPMDHEYAYLLPTGEERLEILDRARPGHLRLVHTYPMGRIFEIDPH